SWYVVFIILRDLLNAAGIAGLLLFALNFPDIDLAPWRRTLQRYVWLLFVLLALSAIAVNFAVWLGHSIQWFVTALGIGRGLLYAFIAGIFLETYARTRGEDRQRVAWITFGFAIGLVGLAFAHTLNVVHWQVASTVSVHERLLSLLIGVVPFAVAYSVVRHHVFDFNVVISHALVYGVLTAIVIAFFSVLHAVAVRTLHSAGASLGIELFAAVVLGFSLEAIRRKLEWLISALFFRRQRLAARHIGDAAATLPRSPSKEAVDAVVVAAPVKAFDLGSAALFRRDESGAYMRRAAFGWSASDDAVFFPDDELVVALQRDRAAVDLEKRHLPRSGMPAGELEPTLACPLLVRGQLEAFALYGPQAGGAALERDQIPALRDLMQAAALAYDELEFASLRARAAQVRRLQEELDALKAGTQVQPM
ncbi:MAG TPA: hypothetical protein VKR99_02370, partial [Candidatus Eremiobacteraceae bacterium]|nr:hypothetical protein [Candidatus Eremiobacteraceae bacterium]